MHRFLGASVLVVSLVGFLALPGTSNAGTVAGFADQVFFEGLGGESNNIEISVDGAFVEIRDVHPIVNPNGPRSRCAVLGNYARCERTGTIWVVAGDAADRVTVKAPDPAILCGGDGNDTLIGGSGADVLSGENGTDLLDGGDGNDQLQAEAVTNGSCDQRETEPQPAAPNTLYGGGGNDLVQGGAADDSLSGGPGSDRLAAGAGSDSVLGNDGPDTLVGDADADSLVGGAGNDLLAGGDGDDSLLGEEGNDTLGVTFTVTPVETGQERLVSERGDDRFDGGPGDDILFAGAGDFIHVFEFQSDAGERPGLGGPNGSDRFKGGEGRDSLSYAGRLLPVSVSADGTANDGGQDEGDAVGDDVESLIGGFGDDTLVGRPGPDDLDGGPGADTLRGGAGNDALTGGDGADQLFAGDGDDELSGDPGDDYLEGGPGADRAAGAGGNDRMKGGLGPDDLSGGPGLDDLSGGTGDDRLDGSAELAIGADGADVIRGDGGDDELTGGNGDDLLSGGAGSDGIGGGPGDDTADYVTSEALVRVSQDGQRNDGSQGERDTLSNDVENIVGSHRADSLLGGGGRNVLTGEAGEDFIDGSGGPDTLKSGGANDAVRSRDGQRDLIDCGPGFDFAMVDSRDVTRDNCELVDATTADRVSRGRIVAVARVRGKLRFRPRSMDRMVPLDDHANVPVRSSIDATEGVVRLATYFHHGGKSVARLSGGKFQVDQRRSSTAGEVRLTAAMTGKCGAGSPTRVVRRLVTTASGPLRIRGRLAKATARKGTWVVEDRCDGTLVRVRNGRIRFHDVKSGRVVMLQAGESRLARLR
jgi:Ca2+-binding RTX toxin-like protein